MRKAIESWENDKRVALLASGGLSHVVIDEDIDAMVIDGLKNKKPEVLFQLPRKKLHGGTSEILNWVALAGGPGGLVTGNIPYNITSPLLDKALTPPRPRRIAASRRDEP